MSVSVQVVNATVSVVGPTVTTGTARCRAGQVRAKRERVWLGTDKATGWQDGRRQLQAASLVECCFTSTETVGLLGKRAQDGHLDFHTAHEL